MRASRWITAIAVLVGLAAMHGIAASSASAAAPCGVAAVHAHGEASADVSDGTLTASVPAPADTAHAGMACLVILLAGFTLALTVHRRRDADGGATPTGQAYPPTRVGRGPPLRLLSCVSRT